MRKNLTQKVCFLILCLSLTFNLKLFAQTASQYGFTAVSGTYTPITGGTAFTAVQSDDVMPAATIPLNFSFNFCGVSYTAVRVCSNGLVTFSTTASNTAFNDVTSFGTIKPALMWLWDDLNGGTTGAASYTTTGTAPNRVFTFEFKNWRWYWNATGPNISCQVKLYETTNVIEYVYNQESQAGTPNSASIGIVDGLATPTYLSLNNSSATPTASSATFTTNIASRPASGQIYRFTPPPNCSAVSTWPSSATTTMNPTSVCVSQNVTLTYTPATPLPAALGVSYQWQSAPAAGGPWTTIGTSATPSFVTLANAPLFYRCQLMCNTTSVIMTASATAQLVVNNPGTPTVTGATRCGPGTLTLNATPPAGSSIVWYAGATGGAPLATTNSYTTPYLPATTTFYAAASAGGFGPSQALTTTTAAGNGCDGGVMFDIDPNVNISIDSFVALANATTTAQTITIYKKTGTYLGSETNAAAWTTVATLTVNTTNGQMVNLPLPAPLLVNANVVTGIYLDYTSSYTTMAAGTMFSNADMDIITGAGLCDPFSSVNAGRAFNGAVHYRTAGCEGSRQPVTATITPGPALTIAKPAVVCSGEIGNIMVTSAPMTNYTNYTWTPNVADLYTNAGATTPYTAGSAPNIYFKSTDNGAHTYYLFSSGATPAACTRADTFSIWVQPDSLRIVGMPDTICVTGSTVLTLEPSTGYAPNTIQWQESANGTIYSNITGATGVSYTTPTLTANRYYRVLMKSTNDTCEMPVKHVVIANPQLLGVTDSFNCGPGTVTLQAQTGGNSTAKWYEASTGGLAIGSGSPWTTPSLSATQTFYVSAGGGTGGGAPVTAQVGTGTASTGGAGSSPGPFSIYYRRYAQEYLYTASEIIAAGGNAGELTSVAFNCTSLPANPIPNFTIKIKFVPSAMTTLTWQTGTTQVYTTASLMPTLGWNVFTFTGTPVTWNGTDNIVVEVCRSQVQPTWNSSGNHQSTTVTGRFLSNNTDAAGSSCGITGTSTNTNLPNVRFGMQGPCETPRQAVQANIYPKPAVDLGQDMNICADVGAATTLDAGAQPNTPAFLWDDNSTGQMRAVTTSGTYYVTVTNQYTCKGSDTIEVKLRKNPVVNLGNDTSVCNGVTLTLNAGSGGVDYFWSTGQTGQTIDVNTAGSYNVFVTNAEGCTKTDTIQVMMQGELPTIQGIQVTNNAQRTFQFTALYPQNVIAYEWDFGDGSPYSNEAAPTHTYDSVGDYIVVLRLSSTCGFAMDTVPARIVGIRQLNVNNEELMVYPNPSNGRATILNKGSLKMEKIEIYNILGQVVYRSETDAADKHIINLGSMAGGVYTIEVYTDKGTVARKLEIIR